MKKSILFINTARGGIVNEMDLVTALKNHEIAGVGFDVLSEEPPTGGNPLLDLAKTMPNVLVTPHVAWAGKKSATNSINFAINHLEKFFRGEEIPSLTT